jgi:hypothetical protein
MKKKKKPHKPYSECVSKVKGVWRPNSTYSQVVGYQDRFPNRRKHEQDT